MTTQTESIARRAAKDINKGYDIKARIEMAIKEALAQSEQLVEKFDELAQPEQERIPSNLLVCSCGNYFEYEDDLNDWTMTVVDKTKEPEQQPVAWHVYFGNEDEPNYVCIGEKPIEARAVIRPLVFGDTTPPQRKPLTDEQIMEMVFAECDNMRWPSTALYIARAIEAAHGIKD